MKKLIILLFVIASLSATAKSNKYWHRKHQNKIFQQFIQSHGPNKGLLSKTFAPKGDIFRFLNKYH